MSTLTPFLTSFKGVSSLLVGREAVREAVKTMRHAQIALIGLAVAAGIGALCFLVITAYVALLLGQEIAAF